MESQIIHNVGMYTFYVNSIGTWYVQALYRGSKENWNENLELFNPIEIVNISLICYKRMLLEHNHAIVGTC